MARKNSVAFLLALLLFGSLVGCQTDNRVGVDERQAQGFTVKTFFNSSENVEVTVASDGSSSIVALPKAAIGRRNQISDDDLSCLAKCAKIEDLEARLNCLLLCPATKQWQVAILRAQ